MRRALVLCVAAMAASGCLADARLSRMKLELADDIRMERRAEAMATERRMLALADKAFGSGSPETVRARVELAGSHAQWGQIDRALSLAEETVSNLDPDDRNQPIVPAMLSLAEIQLYARQWKASEQTTDRVVDFCRAAPPHTATEVDPFDECHFARYRIDDLYLGAGAYEKFAREYLLLEAIRSDPRDRERGILELAVLGRGYAQFGAYPEAAWYLQRCVDEDLPRYLSREAPPSVREVAREASGNVEVFTLDSAHSFRSQSPRCLEDLMTLRRAVGDDTAANQLASLQRDLWSKGPDLEQDLIERIRKSDRTWRDGYNTSHDTNNLAFYYAAKGRTQDAIRTWREGIRLIDDRFAKDGRFAGVYPAGLLLDELLGLGQACEEAGLASEALAAYERATLLAERQLHPHDARRLQSRAGAARAMLASGRRAESEAAWRRFLDVAGETRGRAHADYATGLEGRARALEADGRRTAAIPLHRHAASIRAAYLRRVESANNLPLPVSLRSPAPPAN